MTILLDSHVLHWWSAEPERLGPAAARAVTRASELAVAAISWFELAWLARHERIAVNVPIRSWLAQLAEQVRSVPLSSDIADTAVALPASFPGDPADRLIYATAIETGWQLVTRDERLRGHRHPRKITVW